LPFALTFDIAVYLASVNSSNPATQGKPMANPFVHVELMSTDVNRSKEFYGKLFDWKMQDMPNPATGTYTLINVGEGTGGGMMTNPMPGAPSSWMAYVLVDDVKAATSKATSLGANIMKDVTEVPDMGRFSIITDPTGAMLGLWQSKNR
jgi:predicted enzyme related to lactoylglutathione lyase